jgi:predicted nucleic acid-binding protein
MEEGTTPGVTIVDTTVWIDFFRGKNTPETEMLQHMLNAGEDICICGVILTEVLQGTREDADYKAVASRFEAFLFLPMHHSAFVDSAQLYRALRRKGITVRNAVDCMIAAVAIEHDIPILHHDRDFDPLAEHCGLKVIKTRKKPASASNVAAHSRRKTG